jgi:hypothetical protein
MEKIKDFSIPIIDENSIILICVIKNEYLLLEYFIEHYSKIGVTHFIFIDNDSSDNTIEYLKNIKFNIMIYKTSESYKTNNFGVIWITYILDTYCKNKWCVVVDSDEIIYIDKLNMLRNQMIDKNNNVCKFYLLDMYPKNYNSLYKRGEPFLNHSNYYDKESSINKDYWSGVRKRTMNVKACLHKKSFFKYTFFCCANLNVGYHTINIKNKEHTCVSFYNNTQILLHYKFIKPNLKEFFNNRIKQNQDWNNSIEYKKYSETENYNFYDPEFSLCIDDTKPYFSFIK